MCKYSYCWPYAHYLTGHKCNRKEYKAGFCIFHCDKKNFTEEETEKFYEEFRNEFERQEKDDNLKEFDFIGFNFPGIVVPFVEVGFKKPVRFTNATFNGIADFSNATFNDDVYFEGVKFNSLANFDCTIFQKSARFVGLNENKIFKGAANFALSNFNTPEDVEFLNVNLSKASLLHCKNIDRIGRFERIKWSETIGLLSKRKASILSKFHGKM